MQTTHRLLLGLALLAAQPLYAGDIFKGREIYQQHCLRCHGSDGSGTTGNTPDFRRAQGLFQPDYVLLKSLKYGKGVMPAYLGILEEEQLNNVMAYVRTLQ